MAAMSDRGAGFIAALAVLLSASSVAAQQPSISVVAAAQVVTADAARMGGQHRVEPDLGILLVNPGFRFGALAAEISLTRRDEQAVLGRSFLRLEGVKLGGLSWTLDAGDAWRTPTLSEFGYTNLFAPPVTFEGLAISGASPRTRVSVSGGRVTALRNIFGTDTIPVGQQLYQAFAPQRLNDRLDVYGRGAHVWNGPVEIYTTIVDVSTDVSGGTRYRVTPSVELSGEAGVSQFRRRGSSSVEQSPSGFAGAIWSAPKGWLQINAHRFPAGYFPTINFPYSDRAGVFTAGEWDAHRLVRLFAGAEAARTNLDEAASSQASSGVSPGVQSRAFGGVRARVGERSLVSVRLEGGGRENQPSKFGGGFESDTGVLTAEWHTGVQGGSAFARYERRENVDPNNQGSSFTQHDASVHTYLGLGPGRQLFAQAVLSRRADLSGDGQTLWLVGGGSQMSLRRWYVRLEGTIGRTSDWTSAVVTNRQTVSMGLSGQIARNTQLSVDCYVDRSPFVLVAGSPWTSRTMVRVMRSFPFGTARSVSLSGSPVRSGPTGRITGVVFADWNGDGQLDPGEEPVEGISIAVAGYGTVTSGTDGRFSFPNVPVGENVVAVNVATLPAEYDPPAERERALDIARNRASDIPIGLLPLASMSGVVYQDADGDGQLSPADTPISGAVVVLDDGARTEVARAGRFRFDAIRMGTHAVSVLTGSLPDGAQLSGPATVTAELARNQEASEIVFLVKLEKRPEVRKVFPPKK
jgi:hypothetical protein